MQPVTSKWLSDRGGLHDAEVRDVRRVGSTVEIMFNDEWVNERGLSLPAEGEVPGTLTLTDATVAQGDLGDILGGWVYDIELRGNCELHFLFCDRDPLMIQATTATWRGTP
jgi:hypothetical protein